MHISLIAKRSFVAALVAACSGVFGQPINPSAVPKIKAVTSPDVVVAWPSKPIRLLIGFPPGSVQDLSARAISEELAIALGQPVIVENKAGASGTIAADQVAKATDQHTFGVMNNSQLTTARPQRPRQVQVQSACGRTRAKTRGAVACRGCGGRSRRWRRQSPHRRRG